MQRSSAIRASALLISKAATAFRVRSACSSLVHRNSAICASALLSPKAATAFRARSACSSL
eukprot:6809414-Alexandrium_andersonii.AAC.1